MICAPKDLELPEKYSKQMLEYNCKIVRYWMVVMTSIFIFNSFFMSDFTMEKTPVHYIAGHSLYGSIMILLVLSF